MPVLKRFLTFQTLIFRDNAIPCKYNVNVIISLFKGKGEALDRLNYRDFNLRERILKVIQQIIEGFMDSIIKIAVWIHAWAWYN